MKKNTKNTYTEPTSFFPADIRKKYKIGEYAEVVEDKGKKKPAKKK